MGERMMHSTQTSLGTNRKIGRKNRFQTTAAPLTPDVIGRVLNIACLTEHPIPLRRSRVRSSLLRRQRSSAVCAEDGTIRAMSSTMSTHPARLRLPTSIRCHILLLQGIDLHLELVLTLFNRSDRRYLAGISIHKLLIRRFTIQHCLTEVGKGLSLLLGQRGQLASVPYDLRFSVRVGDSAIDGFGDAIEKIACHRFSIRSLRRLLLLEEYAIRDSDSFETDTIVNKFM